MQCTDAVAFEAAAALEDYETHVLAMRQLGADPRRVALVQGHLKRVCNCCLRLPQLSGATIALLLAHHRLLAELAGSGAASTAAAPAGLQEVEQCVVSLQRACRGLFLAPHLH